MQTNISNVSNIEVGSFVYMYMYQRVQHVDRRGG